MVKLNKSARNMFSGGSRVGRMEAR